MNNRANDNDKREKDKNNEEEKEEEKFETSNTKTHPCLQGILWDLRVCAPPARAQTRAALPMFAPVPCMQLGLADMW